MIMEYNLRLLKELLTKYAYTHLFFSLWFLSFFLDSSVFPHRCPCVDFFPCLFTPNPRLSFTPLFPPIASLPSWLPLVGCLFPPASFFLAFPPVPQPHQSAFVICHTRYGKITPGVPWRPRESTPIAFVDLTLSPGNKKRGATPCST